MQWKWKFIEFRKRYKEEIVNYNINQCLTPNFDAISFFTNKLWKKLNHNALWKVKITQITYYLILILAISLIITSIVLSSTHSNNSSFANTIGFKYLISGDVILCLNWLIYVNYVTFKQRKIFKLFYLAIMQNYFSNDYTNYSHLLYSYIKIAWDDYSLYFTCIRYKAGCYLINQLKELRKAKIKYA